MKRPEIDDRGIAILICALLVLLVLLVAWMLEGIG